MRTSTMGAYYQAQNPGEANPFPEYFPNGPVNPQAPPEWEPTPPPPLTSKTVVQIKPPPPQKERECCELTDNGRARFGPICLVSSGIGLTIIAATVFNPCTTGCIVTYLIGGAAITLATISTVIQRRKVFSCCYPNARALSEVSRLV